MHFTQNPIGSDDQLDLQDNAISFDYAMNSPAALWQDRFGKQHKTVQQALKDVGFKPAGFDFVSGGTLGIGDRDKCVFYPTNGYWYSWNGKLPYVVPENSSPTPGGKKGWGVVTRDERVIAREALSRTYLEAGYNLVEGSFEQGGTLNNQNDVLLYEATGVAYSYSGPLPHTITAGETPIGNPLWVDRSHAATSFQQAGSGSVPRTAQDKMRERVSIKDNGAVGDGVTDDTAKIQSVINDCPEGGTLEGVSGVFLLSGQIVINKKIHLHLGNAIFKEATPLASPLFLCSNFDDGSIDGLVIQGAESAVTYAGASALNYVGVKIVSSDRVSVRNVKAFDKSNAVIFDHCSRCEAESVYLKGVIASNLAYAYNSGSVRFIAGEHNRALLCGAEYAGGAVYQTYEGKGLSVHGAWSNDCWDNGVYISSGFNCSVTGGTFRRLNGEGNVGVKARGSGHTITGNTIESSNGGIQISGNGVTLDSEGANGSGNVVTGNTMRNIATSAIVINFQDGYEPRDCTVSGNTLVDVAVSGGSIPAIIIRGNGHHIVGNTINGFSGAYAMNCEGELGTLRRRLKISGNRIRGGLANEGIRLTYVGDSQIDGNAFDGNSGADFVELRSCDNVRIINNDCPTATISTPSAYPSTNLEIWGNKALNLFVLGDQQFQPNTPRLVVAMGGSSLVLSVAQAQAETLAITGAFGSQKTLTLPTIKRQWTIDSSVTGGVGVLIKTAAGAGVVIADGKRAIVYCDGTDIKRVTADA